LLLERSLERKDGREQLWAEAARLELRGNEMHGRDEVLELRVAHHEPLEAELIRLPFDPRARLGRNRVEQLLKLVLGADKLSGRERLEADAGRAGRLQVELGLERDLRGRDREQPLG